MSSSKTVGYKGFDYIEEEKNVIVCPNPKCRYKHVDQFGDTGIFGSPIDDNTKYIEWKCRKCRTLLFKSIAYNPDGSPKDKIEPPIPFWLLKKMRVRRSRFV